MNILRAHPQINVLNEPLGQHIDLFRKYDLFNINNFPLWPIEKVYEFQEVYSYLKDIKNWLSSNVQFRGIKEVLLLNKIEWVLEMFDKYRIILLVRDPRGIIASLYSRGLDLRWEYKLLVENYLNATNISIDFDLDNRIQVCSVVWKLRMFNVIDSLSQFQKSGILLVRTEDVFDDFEAHLMKICEHLGVRFHSNQLAYWQECLSDTRGGLFSDYRNKGWLNAWQYNMRVEHIKCIENIAGEEMAKLGYL